MSAEPPDLSDLPPRLQALPVHLRTGLPVPVFAQQDRDGEAIVDFNKVDRRSVLELAERRWCYLCGQPIAQDEDAWFLGDERSYALGYYPETVGHESCLAASLSLCPYIRAQHHQRATERRLGQPRGLEDDRKPVVWVLASSRYFRVVQKNRRDRTGRVEEHGLYPRRLRNARYFGYDADGALVEVTREHANVLLTAAGLDPIATPSERP